MASEEEFAALERRVVILETLVQRLCHTEEQLPRVLEKALKESIPGEWR